MKTKPKQLPGTVGANTKKYPRRVKGCRWEAAICRFVDCDSCTHNEAPRADPCATCPHNKGGNK